MTTSSELRNKKDASKQMLGYLWQMVCAEHAFFNETYQRELEISADDVVRVTIERRVEDLCVEDKHGGLRLV